MSQRHPLYQGRWLLLALLALVLAGCDAPASPQPLQPP
jgi:hypothetical protein